MSPPILHTQVFGEKRRYEKIAVFEIRLQRPDLEGWACGWSNSLGKWENPPGILTIWSGPVDCGHFDHAFFDSRLVLGSRNRMHSSRNHNRHCRRGAIPENEQIHLPYPKAVGNGDEENRESRFLKCNIFLTHGGFGNSSLSRHQRLHFLLSSFNFWKPKKFSIF